MPVINGVYLKDFPALPSSVADANIIPIAISGNQIAYKTTVAGIVTDARVTSKLLTGLSVTGSTILATDTILQAFGKVQNQLNGKVSSVGLTMPAAFNVANSPITSAGTLAVTAAGVASQYIRGDGALGDFPTTGGGGSSVSYYFNGSVSQGTIGGNAYYEMNKTPVIGTGTDFSIAADGYIAQFITDANDPASLLIPGGNWNVEMYFSASSSGGTPSFYVEVYKYDGSTFTLLGSSSATPESITNGTAIDIYYTSVGIPETVLTITDRLAIRVYVTHSGRTIKLHTEDNHLSEIITTFSNGLTTLNGLTKQAQYFAVGSTGTDFAIVSSVDTHTFNIPSASASNRGLMTTGTQTIAGAKTLTGALVGTSASFASISAVSADGIAANISNNSTSFSALQVINSGSGNIALFSNSGGVAASITNAGSINLAALSNGLVKSTSGLLSNAASGTDYTLLNGTGIVQMAGTTPSYLSSTGSGDVVKATSATLITPVIGAATGTSLDITGRLTFSGNSTASAANQIARDATYGMYHWASSGTTDDFTIFDLAGNYVMHVPHNTNTAVFEGTIRNTSLTASQLVATDASKNLVSVAYGSGTYSPTLTNVTNLTTSGVATSMRYIRVGNVVSYSVEFSASPTGVGACQLDFSIPIASNFGTVARMPTVAKSYQSTGATDMYVSSNVTNDRGSIFWTSTGAAITIQLSGHYEIE